jgi:threonine/homoserine/homoserine lactone efflux protein
VPVGGSMISSLLIGATFGLSAAAQPGPFQAYLVSSTMVHGWRRTLPTVFAPVLSDIPIVAVVLVVLTRIGAGWLDGLRVSGGLFLLYLASKAWRAFRNYGMASTEACPTRTASTASTEACPTRTASTASTEACPTGILVAPASVPASSGRTRGVVEAATVNLLNPNPYIAWSTVLGPLVIRAWRDAPSHALGLVLAFYASMVGSTVVLVLLLAGARSLGPRIGRALVAVSAAALAAFGLYQLWTGGVARLVR